MLVSNWRAPAAEPFYAATAHDPRGIERRRRLDIEDRRVLGFVDETLDSEADSHLTEAIVEDITRRRVGEMRQIIATITPEQYALIRERPVPALVIQGGPGTGKTAVGLHRAAWLLYDDPGLARAGVLVVGPNRTFIRYIGQVLPSLGEQSVEQREIDALISRPHQEVTETRELATLKGSGRMAELLNRLLWSGVRAPEDDVVVRVGNGRARMGPDEVMALQAAARERSATYQGGRLRFRDALAEQLAASAGRSSVRGTPLSHADVLTAVRQSTEYQKLTNRVWPRVAPERLFADLFTNRRRLRALGGDLLSGDEIELPLSVTAPSGRLEMTPTDVALFDEARWLIDPEMRTFGHVVIDEAQNLTPMELRMVTRRARRRSLTILGDIAQRTAEAGLSTWERVLRDAGVETFETRELELSYRVPDDFLRLAAGVADAGTPVPRGVRRAPWPPVAVAADEAAVGAVVARLGARMAHDAGSVAVVVPPRRLDAVRAALEGLRYADATTEELGAGINLVDMHVVKGLEFDAVLVVEPGAILGLRPDGGSGGLYTAFTRSTRRSPSCTQTRFRPGSTRARPCSAWRVTTSLRSGRPYDARRPPSPPERAARFQLASARRWGRGGRVRPVPGPGARVPSAGMRIGLAFGAGGVIGGSWTIGALEALEAATGWRAAQADLVIGTSAGAVIGAMAADGVSGATMAARVAEDAEGEEESLRAGALQVDWGLPSFGPGSWRLAASTLLAPQRYTAAALMAAWLPRGMVSTAPIRTLVESVVTGPWPSATSFRAVAADYATAERVVFGAHGAPDVPVGDAVAASCAIPGYYRPVRIDGRAYVDGGVWSASNLDLLGGAGVDLAICVNPLTSLAQATGGSPSDRIAAVLRAPAARRLEAEAEALRGERTEVLVLQPEAPDVALMGFNMMSGARRLEVMAQARRTVAAQLETRRVQGAMLPGRGRRRSAA